MIERESWLPTETVGSLTNNGNYVSLLFNPALILDISMAPVAAIGTGMNFYF